MKIISTFSAERAIGFGIALINSQDGGNYHTMIWEFTIVFLCFQYRCEFQWPKTK